MNSVKNFLIPVYQRNREYREHGRTRQNTQFEQRYQERISKHNLKPQLSLVLRTQVSLMSQTAVVTIGSSPSAAWRQFTRTSHKLITRHQRRPDYRQTDGQTDGVWTDCPYSRHSVSEWTNAMTDWTTAAMNSPLSVATACRIRPQVMMLGRQTGVAVRRRPPLIGREGGIKVSRLQGVVTCMAGWYQHARGEETHVSDSSLLSTVSLLFIKVSTLSFTGTTVARESGPQTHKLPKLTFWVRHYPETLIFIFIKPPLHQRYTDRSTCIVCIIQWYFQ